MSDNAAVGGVFRPNFVTFTDLNPVSRSPIDGSTFRGNQNGGMTHVTFSDGSGGVEKTMRNWTGKKTGRLYRAEVLAAREYLAARVGEALNSPVRDCALVGGRARAVLMPYIHGEDARSMGKNWRAGGHQGVALRLFDHVTANSDRAPKNVIVTPDGRVVGIDHALCNFKRRRPNTALISELWNHGVTADSLAEFRPRLVALAPVFQTLGHTDGFKAMLANFDGTVAGLRVVAAAVEGVVKSKPRKADEVAVEAMELRRQEKWESAALAHEEAARLYESEAKPADDGDGDYTALRAKAQSQRDLAADARFIGQTGERHAPAERFEQNPPTSVVKGETEGHEFHGNQWTGGIGGGGEPSRQSFTERFPMLADRNQTSADRNQVSDDRNGQENHPTARFIGESAADFTRAGGKISEVSGYFSTGTLVGLQKEVLEEAKSKGFKSLDPHDKPDPKTEPERYQEWSGFFMMNAALDHTQLQNNEEDYRGAVRIFIARDAKGKIAGAAMLQNDSYIHYIGSNHGVDGAGTALIAAIIKNSADKGRGVAFEPLKSAVKFWEMAGFKPKTSDSDTYVMRSDETKRVADQLRGMSSGKKVAKGDREGHEFRGNQYVDHAAEAARAEAEAVAHQERASKLEAEGHNTRAITHALLGMAAHREAARHRAEMEGPSVHSPEVAAKAVADGHPASVSEEDLPKVVQIIHAMGPRESGYDITRLAVDGETPFQTDVTRTREQMPQILPGQRPQFLADISKLGVTSESKEVDPTTLRPSQAEIDGWKTGGVYAEFGQTGIPVGRAPLVTEDGHILDGHHYWSAAVVMHAADPSYRMPVTVVHAPLDQALRLANEWHDAAGNERVGIGHVHKGDLPGHEFHGNQYVEGQGSWKPVMTKAEVDEWAKDSQVQATLYHGTSATGAEGIMANGLRASAYGVIGAGIYLAEDKSAADDYAKEVDTRNPITLSIRVNVHNVCDDPEEAWGIAGSAMDATNGWEDMTSPRVANAIRDAFIAKGYDAVRTPGTQNLVVFDPKNVVVVADEIKKGDYEGHPFHGNQWDKVGPNGLPIPTRRLTGVKAPTKADWDSLAKISEQYRTDANRDDKGALQIGPWLVKPGPAYNKRPAPGLIDGMLKSLGLDKATVDKDFHGVDSTYLFEAFKRRNGIKDDKPYDYLTPSQQRSVDSLQEKWDSLQSVMRLSAIKDGEWPMGHAPAYPVSRSWRSFTMPLNSQESQLAREVLARRLADSIPSARTNMRGLEGILREGRCISGLDLGRTGLSSVSNTNRYLQDRVDREMRVFGRAVSFPPPPSPFIGYMARKDELLDPSKPDDVKSVVETLTRVYDSKDNLKKNESKKLAADVLKNPSDYVLYYTKEWHPGSTGGAASSWSFATYIAKISDAVKWESDNPSSDKAEGEYKTTTRYYPLANADGSINTDVLFGTRTNTTDISRYGDVSIQFKRSTLKDATITPGDSADLGRDPLPAALAAKADPRLSMFDWGVRMDTGEIGVRIVEYVETQWWRQPTVSDIERVVFTGAAPTPTVRRLLEENKVPYSVLGSEKPLASYALKPSQFRKIYSA